MTPETKAYLDSMDDEIFIAHILMLYGTNEPVWEKCSQKEYEKYNGKAKNNKFTIVDLKRSVENIVNRKIYRAVPIYNNGGDILNQIQPSDIEPDFYIYEKLTGYRTVLYMGSELINYCKTRECMKPFLESV